MKKIDVIVKDKNTLVLVEDAKSGDVIDLTSLTKFDKTAIEKTIEEGLDKVYNEKLNDVKSKLELEKNIELNKLNAKIEFLNQEHQAKLKEELVKNSDLYKDKINELNNKLQNQENDITARFNLSMEKERSGYVNQIQALKNANDSLKQEYELRLAQELTNVGQENNKRAQAANDKINTLQAQIDLLLKTQDTNLKNKELELKNEYETKILNMNSQLTALKTNAELEKEKAIFALKQDYDVKIREKEDIINNLQNQKASLNVKQTGEDLESYCNNIVTEQMQNGFLNCTWEKDNTVVKDDGEKKGSKADYIFKVYASNQHLDSELLASVCLDMKDENPDSINKQTNEHYYKQLNNNRIKKNCRYAVLVSNLETNKPNALPIYKVREYDDMYVVRPGYLMTFLHLITSLTTRFKDLLLANEKEKLEIKEKYQFLEEFNTIKNTYLDKPLELLEKDVNNIIKANDSIVKASNDIYSYCSHIATKYIGEIESKIEKFEIKLNKEYRKIEIN